MQILLLITIVGYGLITILRWFFGMYLWDYLIPYTRYFYVVLHELGHLIMGLLMGKGVDKVVLLPDEALQAAGYYQPAQASPFRILWIHLGDALTSLAGPVLPPIFLYFMIRWALKQEYHKVLIVLIIGLVLIFWTSPQRWLYLIAFIILATIGKYLQKINPKFLNYLILIFVYWAMIGMFDELPILGGYNRHGSDMGNFTHAILRADNEWLSWILNKGMQVYYLWMLKVYTEMIFKNKNNHPRQLYHRKENSYV